MPHTVRLVLIFPGATFGRQNLQRERRKKPEHACTNERRRDAEQRQSRQVSRVTGTFSNCQPIANTWVCAQPCRTTLVLQGLQGSIAGFGGEGLGAHGDAHRGELGSGRGKVGGAVGGKGVW